MPRKNPEPANWEAAPEGPPNKYTSKYIAVRTWLDEHPGEWAVIHSVTSGTQQMWRGKGYETQLRSIGEGRHDLYVRKPVKRVMPMGTPDVD